MPWVLAQTAQNEEEYAFEKFYRDLQFVNSRYEIRWPWRNEPPNLTNNFPLAMGRLRSLHQKLTPEFFFTYNKTIQDQLAAGIIERVPDNELHMSEAFYLPHRAVLTPEKSTAFRVVYDGLAKSSKSARSLNAEIYKGSNLLANIDSVGMRFRTHPVACVSDIEKAFLQISV